MKVFGDKLIKLPGSKSISYHAPTFFLEVLPRKNRLVLILPLDFSEVEVGNDSVYDASQSKFFFYAEHSGGVYMRINDEGQIKPAMKVIAQAHRKSLVDIAVGSAA